MNELGEIIRCKARLVVRGFEQHWGIDFIETFVPVAIYISIRILFVITAVKDLEIHQMDVVLAFLTGHIDEEVYTKQPEGFEKGEDLVCLLNQSLYALK
jgi:Reverse transcriptase (RNA-dependent DNA polymerase)